MKDEIKIKKLFFLKITCRRILSGNKEKKLNDNAVTSLKVNEKKI